MASGRQISGKTKSGIFFARYLDDPNQLEPAREIRFRVQLLFAGFGAIDGKPMAKTALICPSGKSGAAMMQEAWNRNARRRLKLRDLNPAGDIAP